MPARGWDAGEEWDEEEMLAAGRPLVTGRRRAARLESRPVVCVHLPALRRSEAQRSGRGGCRQRCGRIPAERRFPQSERDLHGLKDDLHGFNLTLSFLEL